MGQIGKRLDVVYHGGASEKPFDGGKRRLDFRVAPAALNRSELSGLFAADIGARPSMHCNIQIKIGAKNAFAKKLVVICFVYSFLQNFRALGELATDVNIAIIKSITVIKYSDVVVIK